MSRFFVEPENIGSSKIFIDDRDDLHHMIKVLRLAAGDEIDISDGEKWEYRAVIDCIDSDCCEADIVDKQRFAREPETEITLFQGIPKQGKMEVIVQKNVELGVKKIVPVFMKRTVVTDKGNLEKKVQRWQKVAAEAVKQCKRGVIPEVSNPVRLADALQQFPEYDLVLFPYEDEMRVTIKDVLREIGKNEGCRSVAVIIGPEGGFAEEEAKAVNAAGGRSVSLGKTVLRTETAGMAAVSMVMYEMEL